MSRRPSDLDPELRDASKPVPEPPDGETPEARPAAELLTRTHVAALDAILGQPFKVLDDGFVRVLDYMGDDGAIVQAARISYGAGTKKIHEDRGLIRYLMRHRHSTPYEMCDIKFHVRVPMDTWRQWVRHRTACLAAAAELFVEANYAPHARGALRRVSIEELYETSVSSAARRRRVHVRQMNEDTGALQPVRVAGVFKNGTKPVFRMTLSDGKAIECTADHRFKFAGGWQTLEAATGLGTRNGRAVWTDGDYHLYVNGAVPARQPSGTSDIVAARLERVERFEYIGEKETYDVEVEGPYHNFIANGIVTHNSVNEYSTRYSVAIDATQQTPPGRWRTQSAANRQGSGGTLSVEVGETLSAAERALQDEARRVYDERLAAGVAREQARKDLPLSTYTEAYWKINLHNLLHFLDLRMDDHAQEEIRSYARVIGGEIVAKWVPVVWEAFLDYRRRAMHLSAIEAELIRLINLGDRAGAIAAAERHGLLTRRKDGGLARNRERAELEGKLAALGVAVPWA